MILLSGKEVQDDIKKKLKEKIGGLTSVPKLVIIQVGENEQSGIYINRKKKFGEELGITVEHKKFQEAVTEEEIIQEIEKDNQDESVGGIIVQLPIPKNLNLSRVLNSIDVNKDVDGLSAGQMGLLYSGNEEAHVPATARGVISLLDYYEVNLNSKSVCVVGRSNLVGRPIAEMCLKRNATLTICHSHTKNLEEFTRVADVLVVACGVPNYINDTHTREGQVVIDVGIHKTDNGICGDVDFAKVKDVVSAITPVPGGVGPLTVASLFQNLVYSA